MSSVGAVTYVYDAMGNVQTETGGDNRSYTYDNENRLIVVQWGASSYRTEFAYDALSRLRKRTERFLSGGVWTLIGETRYLYDGMQVVQERDGSNVPTVTYTRGKDLSGSLQGAGGIGGMLSRSHGYSAGSWSTHSYYHADGLGNITRLVNSTNGVVGSYKYDAYGRTISSSGALGSANVYRFSSKMWIYDGTPGYYYFGYRFYQPSLQRWLNRDPIGEVGGLNLYGYVFNSPVEYVDPLGLIDGGTIIRTSWSVSLSFGGAALGFLAGGGAGLLTGPGAAVASPAGAVAGSAVGAGLGAAAGYGIGNAIANALGYKCDSKSDSNYGGGDNADDNWKPKARDKKEDKMGGEDSDPFKGKGPKKGTPEYEKWRRQLEKDKAGEGRGGRDNREGPFEPPV